MARKAADGRLDPFQKEFVSLLRDNARRHRVHEVFRDFCEITAITFSNSMDRSRYKTREARHLAVIKRYSRDEVTRFALMLAKLTMSLEAGMSDCLGQIFMALELGDHWKGQYFTPYEISLLMVRITVVDIEAKLKQEQFVTVNEPAVGAGGMVIALADALQVAGINYQESMHVTAQDIDSTAVHMAYIQLSLLGVPAVVIHGNSLTAKSWDHWLTPMHVIGGWGPKLKRRTRWKEEAA